MKPYSQGSLFESNELPEFEQTNLIPTSTISTVSIFKSLIKQGMLCSFIGLLIFSLKFFKKMTEYKVKHYNIELSEVKKNF